MKKAEIDHKFDEPAVFAEIERFLDTPVKRYSSGMYVRLAFAVAAGDSWKGGQRDLGPRTQRKEEDRKARSFLTLRLLNWMISLVLLVWSQGCAGPQSVMSQKKGDRAGTFATGARAAGPLSVHPSNPRYFTDGSGRAIYLTGSHIHQNFQDKAGERRGLDYDTYLDFLQKYNHNFIRLWTWEDSMRDPLPYLRTGPGLTSDGLPKFDLTRFNQTYFDRLRARVVAASERGLYVSIMLFQGWSIEDKEPGRDIWRKHPSHQANNINGINGDPDRDGQGIETHTLQNPEITSLQEAYVRKVIDTINDLDNVLYEISNETSRLPDNTAWQYHIVHYIKRYEESKPKQHPVGMTAEWPPGDNSALSVGPADWISPAHTDADPYKDNPPAANGNKIILSDTDHLWGAGGNQEWAWKSFVRGLHPIFMDGAPPWNNWDIPEAENVRRALGYTKAYASKMNLAAMVPRGDLCSTTYCLVNPGKEYLVYLPEPPGISIPFLKNPPRNTVTVDLSEASGTLIVEWFVPSTGRTISAGTINGEQRLEFTAPFGGDAVLYLSAEVGSAMLPASSGSETLR